MIINYKMILLTAVVLIFTSCSNNVNNTNRNDYITDEPFITVYSNQIEEYKIVYDKDTMVMYIVSTDINNGGSMEVMLNSDGTPKLWKYKE